MFRKSPIIEDLKEYIKKNLKKGYTPESLRWALINQGYSKMEVDNAFKKVDQELADKAPLLKTKPEIEYRIVAETQEQKKSVWQKWFSKK